VAEKTLKVPAMPNAMYRTFVQECKWCMTVVVSGVCAGEYQ